MTELAPIRLCSKCPARILWAKTVNGKMMPLDAKPEKRYSVRQDQNGEWVAEAVAVYTPHWSTCPKADEFRKPKEA